MSKTLHLSSPAKPAASLHQYGFFRRSHIAIVVVLSTGIAEQRRVGGAIFRGGVRDWVPTPCPRKLATLYQRLKQVLTDVAHSIGVCLFRVGELVNPDCLRHAVLQVQAPLWHRCKRANSCSKGQLCSVGNQVLNLEANLGLNVRLRDITGQSLPVFMVSRTCELRSVFL